MCDRTDLAPHRDHCHFAGEALIGPNGHNSAHMICNIHASYKNTPLQVYSHFGAIYDHKLFVKYADLAIEVAIEVLQLPSPALSAFEIFCNEHADAGEDAEALKAAYKALSKAEKADYKDKAETDKSRFDDEWQSSPWSDVLNETPSTLRSRVG